MGLQVVLETDQLDQTHLLFKPVGVVFFGVMQLNPQHLAADIVLVLLAELDTLAECGADFVFQA